MDPLYDKENLCRRELKKRKERIRRGKPPENDIEVDIFIEDCYSSPTRLTRQDVKELTGQ